MQNYLFTSDIFKGSRYEKGHPLDMDRVWPSVELIRLMGWINENQIITLLVDATVEAMLSAAEISTDNPISTKRTVQTQVSVYNGETVIIGGLIADNIIRNKKYVPILSAIPVLGYLFKTTAVQKEQRELLMFITPTIYD